MYITLMMEYNEGVRKIKSRKNEKLFDQIIRYLVIFTMGVVCTLIFQCVYK